MTADPTPPADDQAARSEAAERYVRVEAARTGWRVVSAAHSEALTLVLAELERLRSSSEEERLRSTTMHLHQVWIEQRDRADVLSGLLRGMARRASGMRQGLLKSLDAGHQEMSWRLDVEAARDAHAAREGHALHVRDVALAQVGRVRTERATLWKILGRPDGGGLSVELRDAVADERDARRRFQKDAAERDAQVAAVRALAERWIEANEPAGETLLAVLDVGPTEAPAMRYELSCITCSPSPHFHLAPFESNAERQAWADAHQVATGHEDFRFTDTPASVGPAEALAPTAAREALGRRVREVWVQWASEQPEPKPSWLVGWDDLDAGQREVDMRIGEAFVGPAEAAEPARPEWAILNPPTGLMADLREELRIEQEIVAEAVEPLRTPELDAAFRENDTDPDQLGDEVYATLTAPTSGDYGPVPSPAEAAEPAAARRDVYVRMAESRVVKTFEPAYGVAIDVDTNGDVVGVEMIDAVGVEIDGLRVDAGSVASAPAPGYPRIADAITAACEAADIDLTVVHDGRVLDYVPGVVWLATVLDKAGLIDWTAFEDVETS